MGFDKKVWQFPGKMKLTLQGHSRGAEATCFRIPELNWCLDAGIEVYGNITSCFLTHGHMDHAQSLPTLLSRRCHTTFYAPEGVAKFAENYIFASHQMNDCSPNPYPRNYSFVPVQYNQKYEINPTGKKAYTMMPIKCDHIVPCAGYLFWEPRSKLKEDYKKLTGEQIGKLRKSGVEVSETMEQPLFVFMGDTAAKVFASNPQLFTFPVIITECTYLVEEVEKEAEEKGHTSWVNLKPFVVANPQTTFVIIHFSLKHSNAEITEFFKNENLPNVVAWCD